MGARQRLTAAAAEANRLDDEADRLEREAGELEGRVRSLRERAREVEGRAARFPDLETLRSIEATRVAGERRAKEVADEAEEADSAASQAAEQAQQAREEWVSRTRARGLPTDVELPALLRDRGSETELRAYGLSVAEIAHELQRSPRMVRKVIYGESSGALYVAALRDLLETGRTNQRPARRRARDGALVPVRARRGSTSRTRRPEDVTQPRDERGPELDETTDHDEAGGPGPRDTDISPAVGHPQGTTADREDYGDSTTYLPGGARQHSVPVPPREGVGKERARERIMDVLRSAARGQSHGAKNVTFTLTLKDGSKVDIGSKGGYKVSKALQRARNEGKDPLGWLSNEAAARKYLEHLNGRLDITSVDITVF